MNFKALIPNFITSLNLLCGCVSVGMAFLGKTEYAAYLILAGAVFDFFDGFAARLLKAGSPFGKELDSLSDLVTFGVAPGAILFTLLYPGFQAAGHPYYAFAAFFFTLCAALRLAKFNTDAKQSHSFSGLPSPAAGIFVASLPLIVMQSVETMRVLDITMNHAILDHETLTLITAIVSVLMILPLPLIALKFKSFSLKENLSRYLLLISSILLLIIFYWASVPMIILLYVIISLIANLKRNTHEIQS